MEQADRLLSLGDLAATRAALVRDVRENPGDLGARMFLFQLLLLTGEWDKAEVQLRALAQTSPDAQMLNVVYAQAIAAEKTRSAAFGGEAPFVCLMQQSPWLTRLADALGALARGDAAQSLQLRDLAFDEAPEMPGRWGETPFRQISDSDARFGPAFEAIIGGRWGLIGFDEVLLIKSEGPRDLRDLVWLPVEMTFRGGRSAAALLPVRYPGTEAAEDSAPRLARSTDWRDGPLGAEGIGQRLWFLDDGSECGLLSVRRLQMD
jgi:protein involved in temperature-dependent protein secretion